MQRASAGAEVERLVLLRTGMVRLTVVLEAASGRAAQDLLDALRFLIPGTQLEHGCAGCSAWTEPNFTVHYIEDWDEERQIRDRVRSEAFTLLLAIVESARNPRVQFDFVSSTRGLDYVVEIRDETQGARGL